MRLSSTKDPASANILEEATSMLEQKDRDLANVIRGIYSQTEEPQEPLQKALQHMVQPAISTVFAGYLTMGTLLYVWDQVIIGLDQPAYNCLPAFSTAFILLLWNYLKTCQSFCLPGATCTEYQYLQEPDLRTEDRQGNKRADYYSFWKRLKEPMKHKGSIWKNNYHRHYLEKRRGRGTAWLIQDEKQLRYEIQRKAEAQINGLHAEIKRLMEKRLSIDAYSEGSLTAPAPSLQSLTPSQTLHPQPSPVQTPPPTVTDGTNRTREIHGKTAKTITLDLLEQLMQAANTIANGSNAAEHDSLNAATKEHLWNYNQDCKNAEIEVFGHQINTEDREKIPEPKRQLREKLTTAISRNAEAHYKVQFEAVRMLSEPDYMV
ncbi:uncharacterized protein LOC125623962 isoform X2 [Caretta caretta]|uniref:uncharacterized protein LOC125623962 isoform X2 n=2 Tax=Caretta caretta TaxID=8467 RepID=UPI003F4CA6EC